jgi:type II secretory pathway component PulK
VPEGEQGYALIAAVASIALFAGVALAIASATRIDIASAGAAITRAKASAAADAGVAIALHGLVSGDEDTLALLDGGTKEMEVAGGKLTYHLEDERGKIPLNHVEEPTITRMLALAGLGGHALDVARDSLLDWLDDDDTPRADGAEASYYEPLGIAPRNGAVTVLDELGRVRGFSPALVARLRLVATADPNALPFDPAHAAPGAIAAMNDGDSAAPQDIEREHEAAGERVALSFSKQKLLVGRPVTIVVDAETAGGGRAHREAVVVITTNASHPYLIHSYR